jgi:hypothetical protein
MRRPPHEGRPGHGKPGVRAWYGAEGPSRGPGSQVRTEKAEKKERCAGLGRRFPRITPTDDDTRPAHLPSASSWTSPFWKSVPLHRTPTSVAPPPERPSPRGSCANAVLCTPAVATGATLGCHSVALRRIPAGTKISALRENSTVDPLRRGRRHRQRPPGHGRRPSGGCAENIEDRRPGTREPTH